MMQNILINLNMADQYRDSLLDLGFELEDIYSLENDLGLGYGGIGRLAACFLDSMTTLELPVYGYGIRYHYGNFKQHIVEVEGKQVEIPNFSMSKKNPWEIQRHDVVHKIPFYGTIRRNKINVNGLEVERSVWEGAEVIKAMAYDTPIPGFNTFNTNNLRLWSAMPQFD
mmetsp:Transcript_19361/g.14024  ORF Transcript_19361/g.14024 Transcript_19361/m.14024 type:complete len:169 (+) Transcript_19361:516-1022(+)